MMRAMTDWLSTKWRRQPAPDLLRAYVLVFSTPEGQLVLRDWMDEVYCQTCPINDPQALAEHNGQRKFIHRILEAIDEGSTPDKYNREPLHQEMIHG